MSSHESIAAQFWLWPDPVMKRDSQGRILFINAAFLQLYGGTVESWTGNVLQGWPAPQPTEPGAYPVPYRFETRMPSQDPNQSEDIYDWIEQSAPDGTAFALARNVSPFVSVKAPQTQTPQGQESAPQQLEAQQQASHQQAYEAPEQASHQEVYEAPEQASYHEPAHDSAPRQTYDAIESSASPASSHDGSGLAERSEYQDAAPAAAEPAPIQQTAQQPTPQEEQDFQAIAEMASEDDPSANEEPTAPGAGGLIPSAKAPEAETGESEKRDFERRALPLEENSAVLGNNWRDAVIAKALGVEEDNQPAKTVAPEAGGEAGADAPQAGPTLGGAASQGPEKRILLAEDNAINALLTRTLLEAEGHTVETVEDGVLAVEAMKNQTYDLIFMDMRMPNMDGLEATRKIRALPHVTKELPIIALTANAFDDDRNACFDSGMNDFMTKPVSAEELTQMVRTWAGAQSEKDAA